MDISLERLYQLLEEHGEWTGLDAAPRESLQIVFDMTGAEVFDSVQYESRDRRTTFYVHVDRAGNVLSIEVA